GLRRQRMAGSRGRAPGERVNSTARKHPRTPRRGKGSRSL
ncbi:MAG: hypothetical protein AVDCRST_MAG87-2749, partial [uncultured Thermomicrobiales bacterium]